MKKAPPSRSESYRARRWLGSLARCFWLALLLMGTTYVVLFYLAMVIPGITSITIMQLGGWPIAVTVIGLPVVLWIQTRRLAWGATKTVHSYAWLSVFLFSLVVLFYSIERYRGRSQWQQLLQIVDAPDDLTLTSLRPDPVPSDDNFVTAPAVQHWMNTDRTSPAAIQMQTQPSRQRQIGAAWEWQLGRNTNLRSVLAAELGEKAILLDRAALPAPEAVLLGLQPYEKLFEKIREAGQRPYARFPIPYEEGYRGILADESLLPLIDLARLLRLRACALLQLNRSPEAWEDLQLILRLAEYTSQSPMLYRETLRLLSQAIQPLWEGLAEHRWSTSQLEAEGMAFAKHTPLNLLPSALEAAALLNMGLVESIFPTHSPGDSTFGPTDWLGRRLFSLARLLYPTGWSLENQAGVYLLYREAGSQVVNLVDVIVKPQEAERLGRQLLRAPPSLDPLAATFLLPRWVQTVEYLPLEFAYLQSLYQQASVACALECYHLTNGGYPERLVQLVPTFLERLPRDVIGGGPLHYQRISDGSFLLYSIGWNERDEEGQVSWQRPFSNEDELYLKINPSFSFGFVRPEEGDWAWSSTPEGQPQNAP